MEPRRERGVETNSMASSGLVIDEGTIISWYLHDIAFADRRTFAKQRPDYLQTLAEIRAPKRRRASLRR
jgi:hypothetical protein